MFGRQITMKLKANSANELTRINDNEIVRVHRREEVPLRPGGVGQTEHNETHQQTREPQTLAIFAGHNSSRGSPWRSAQGDRV